MNPVIPELRYLTVSSQYLPPRVELLRPTTATSLVAPHSFGKASTKPSTRSCEASARHGLHELIGVYVNMVVFDPDVDAVDTLTSTSSERAHQWEVMSTLLNHRHKATGLEEDWNSAIEAHRHALTGFERIGYRAGAARIGTVLAYLLQHKRSWRDVYENGKRASRAIEESACMDSEGLSQAFVMAPLYASLVEACMNLGDDLPLRREAMVFAEAGKARRILHQMNTVELQPPSDAPKDLIIREQDLRRQLRDVNHTLMSPGQPAPEATIKHQRRLKTQLAEVSIQIGLLPNVLRASIRQHA